MTDSPSPPARPPIRLITGRDKRVRSGHPWVYSNEIKMDEAAKAVPPGTIVRLEGADSRPLGTAMFTPHALIAARLLDRKPDTVIDAAFLAGRLRRALALRERLYQRPFYRLIHAEADGLPALIIDRYGPVVAIQANAAGSDRLLPLLLDAVDQVLAPDTVILRNDSAARTLEGLKAEIRIAKGHLDGPVTVEENGATFFANLAEGQKTGWFYDQRDNRAFAAGLARGGRVIDYYSYGGGFALSCARAGATHVTAVDRSEAALTLAARAAAANGVENRVSFVKSEAFEDMERRAAAGERFDLVIADPPAFVKSRKDLQAGAKGYRKMTRLAAALVQPEGFLLAASCSHNVDPGLFAEQVALGLHDAGKTGRILRFAGAAPDHPVHPMLPESAYLKAILLQVD